MKIRTNSVLRNVQWRMVSAGAVACLLAQAAFAQTIPNPSFEASSFSVPPGYIQNNAPIPGWTANYENSAGLNPAGGLYDFANNGAIPNGNNVAFLEWGTTTLATTISGLTPGNVYNVTFRVNVWTSEPASAPVFRVSIDDQEVLGLNVYPVGGTSPYAFLSFDFTASAASHNLTLLNDSGFNEVILLDDFVVGTGGKWAAEPWTSDADSGVDAKYVYTHAYSFASGANATINDVLFAAVGGPNPTVADKFSTLFFGNVFNNDGNTLTAAGGGSASLARDFLYSASVPAGTFQTIRMLGLTPGTEYVATVYTVGWESPSTTARWATIAIGDARLTFNQDQFDNDNGLRLSCRYVADSTGTAEIRIAPVNPNNVSIHVYGFSNREAESRNVAPSINLQPAGTTVSAGVPVTLSVAASGFPAPTYAWRLNGQAIPGATSATYTIAAAQAQDAGAYDVVVANSVGSVTSAAARLVVGIPMNNPSFEADAYLSWPGYSGNNPGGGPDTPPGENGPITGWTLDDLNGAGINPISNGASPFADNGVIPHGIRVAFMQANRTLSQTVTLTPGSQYYLHFYENARSGPWPGLEARLDQEVVVPARVVPQSGGSNPYREVFSDVFTAAAASANLAFIKSTPQSGDTTVLLDNVAIVPVPAGTAPFISRSPAPVTVSVAGSATLSGQGIGTLPLTFQWLKNGTPLAGATSAALTLSNIQKPDEANYALVVNNSFGAVTSAVARVTVFEPIPDLFNTGLDQNRQPLADGAVDPHWKLIQNPDTGSTDAIVEDGSVFPISDGTWLRNTETSKWIGPQLNTSASAVGTYVYRTTIDLKDRDPKTVVIQGRWASDNTGREIRVNGVATANLPSPVFNGWTSFSIYGTNVDFVAGTNTIDFVVDNEAAIGYTGLRAEFLASNVSIPPGVAPEVTSQPASQTVAEGETVTFTVTVQGASPLTYQWFKNGAPISGATGLSLTLSKVTTADAGSYTIRVSNAVGQATSQPAQLVVAYRLIPGVYGTGVANDGSLLADAAVDPHYILTESADFEYPGPNAIVVNEAWPIGTWLNTGPNSRWIAPSATQGTGNAEGYYIYQTSFDLTGYDLSKVRIVGGWAVDNTGEDIRVNGNSTGITVAGFGGLSTFTLTSEQGLVAGPNTLDFVVVNAPATPNPTGLRIDLRGLLEIPQVTQPTLQATRTGDALSISWAPVTAGQTLQVTTDLQGTWTSLPGAANPFTTNTSASRLFFRIAQ